MFQYGEDMDYSFQEQSLSGPVKIFKYPVRGKTFNITSDSIIIFLSAGVQARMAQW